jgi:hypothetical protein
VTSPRHGTGRAYLISRIAEIDPKRADQVRRGSVSAFRAARDLGITPPRFSIAGENPDTIAEALRRNLQPDVLAAVVARLAGEPS